MLSVVLYFVISTLGIFLFYEKYQKNSAFFKNAAKFPGPKSVPILGNAHLLIGKNSAELYNMSFDVFNPYPSPSRFWMGNHLLIGIYDPDQMKMILTNPKTIEKSDLYEFARPWFGTGLVTATGKIWRARRKLIQPIFSSKILQTFVKIFDKNTNISMKKLSLQLGKKEFQIQPYASDFTLGIVFETILGITHTSHAEIYDKMTASVDRGMELFMDRLLKFWLHPNIIYKFTHLYKELTECIRWTNSTTNNIIRTRRKELLQDDKSDTGKKIDDREDVFLDLLINAQNGEQTLSDQDICDEVKTMIVAGYDTVALALQFTMLMLASHPEIQEKIYQELYEIYGNKTAAEISVEIDDIQRMDYLQRVIKESLRLFPPVPIILRQAQEDVKLGEFILPKGSTLVLPIAKMHRDEKYWKDPLKFDPDRFLPAEIEKRNPYCYMPFSCGSRNCIGSVYAMMEMKTFWAKFLLEYVIKKENIQPICNIKVKVDALGKPVEPVTVKIEKRVRSQSAI